MKFIVITLLFLISFSGCIGDNDAGGKKTDAKDDSTITLASQPSEQVTDPNISTALNSNPTESTVEPPQQNTTTSTTPTPDPIPTTVPTTTTPVPNPNVTTTTVLPPTPNVTTTTIAPNPNVTTTTTIAPSPNVTTTTVLPPTPNVTTTTIAPNPNVTTTVAPPVTTTKRPTPTPCRRFDGPSFIGGIVLAVGLMAISVVAYKFYKARTDRNYHTL